MRQHSSVYFTTPAHALGAQESLHWKTENALRIKGKKPEPLKSLEFITSRLSADWGGWGEGVEADVETEPPHSAAVMLNLPFG